MDRKTRPVWHHFVALAAFLVLTLAFFHPLLEGKVIRQYDVLTYKGASQEIAEFREKNDSEPLWTGSMFSGMPAYQISTYYPGNLISYVHFDLLAKIFFHPASIIFLCMAGFYLLLLSFGLSHPLSAIGAFAFAFSSYFIVIIEAGHNTKGYAIAYMAPILAGIITAYRGKVLLGAALASFALALQIIANHLQITYYTVFIVAGIGISYLVLAYREKLLPRFFKTSGVLVLAALLAVVANITPLMVTYEYSNETIRGKSELTDNEDNKTSGLDKDYALSWSYGVGETMSLMVPNFKGGKSDQIGNDKDALKNVDRNMKQIVAGMDRYFGDQPFTSGNVYVGAIVVFLFVLGLFIVPGPLKWTLGILTLISIGLAWGKNFDGLSSFFLNYIPAYNKFRTVSMILVIAEFTIPLLAFIALHKVITTPALIKEKQKQFWISFGLTGGLAFLMVIMPNLFQSDYFKPGEEAQISEQVTQAGWSAAQTDMLFDGIQEARKKLYTDDAMRTFAFIALAAGLLFLFSRGQVKKSIVIAGLAVLVVGDMWFVNRRFLDKDNFVPESMMKREFATTPADQQILQDPDPNFRVINTTVSTFNDATTSYHHKSIGGYHGAKLRRYQDLIERHISQNNMSVLNMLNTKYFIMPDENNQPVARLNPMAMGNAWFVDSLRWVKNADAEIAALSSFDPGVTAIIDERFKDKVPSFSSTDGSITLKSYQPNHLVYSSTSPAAGFAVFSEIYYNSGKGWQAYIDGEPAEHVRVNYVLRGMVVPEGAHEIEFRFEPSSYFTGEKISMAGSSLLLVLFVFALAYELTRKKREEKKP